jgi:hypothetical protein
LIRATAPPPREVDPMTFPKILCLGFVFAGLFLVHEGIYQFFRARAFLRRAVTSRGRIVREETEKDFDTDTNTTTVYYIYRVRFQTAGGEQVEFTSDRRPTRAKKRDGGQVEVLYDPKDPKDARLLGGEWIYGTAILQLFMGVLAIAVGLCAGAIVLNDPR